MSPTLTKLLTDSCKKVSLEVTDKLKGEFREYVENLTDDEFASKDMSKHILDFVAHASGPAPAGAGATLVKSEEDVPAEDPDEDFNEVTFKGVEYVVGGKTKRVYRVVAGGSDEFEGVLGRGKFNDMAA